MKKTIRMAAMALSALFFLTTTGAWAGQTTYTVSLEEGTEDASNWQGKAGTGEYQVLPLEGVAAGMAVSVKYIGTKKVKSVKAVKKAAADPLAVPLTLEALTDGTIVVNNPKSGMQYSLNGGAKTPVTSDAINVTTGDKVAFYGNGTSISRYYEQWNDYTKIAGGTAQVKVYGNIMSLINENDFATATTLTAESAFRRLFCGNSTLTDASGLLLPAITLTDYCYFAMFQECTSLTAAPTLPATTLAEVCYASMFEGCTSLVTAPALPATTLAEECYYGMFYGCTSLTTAPVLPATALANSCYNTMFYECTSLTAAPELPATTLANYCYNYMFSGCTGLTTAPTLPATTLVEGCYNSMFKECTNLSSVTCMATNITASDCTTEWLDGVAATGTFTKASGATWPTSVDGIPDGWTVENAPNN